MTRECDSDFKKLKKYISSYSISENLNGDNFKSYLKRMHKVYFASIAWNSELIEGREWFLKKYENCDDDIVSRLNESVSDLGSSFFNWIHGNYKSTNIILRSAIENFVRAVSAVENRSQLTEKNTYQLFDIAYSQMSSGRCESFFQSLRSDYKDLCADVHTADQKNMAKLTSLGEFPKFDEKKSRETEKIFSRVNRNMISVFCIRFNSFFHEMHHRNRQNILDSVSKQTKPFIANPTE